MTNAMEFILLTCDEKSGAPAISANRVFQRVETSCLFITHSLSFLYMLHSRAMYTTLVINPDILTCNTGDKMVGGEKKSSLIYSGEKNSYYALKSSAMHSFH